MIGSCFLPRHCLYTFDKILVCAEKCAWQAQCIAVTPDLEQKPCKGACGRSIHHACATMAQPHLEDLNDARGWMCPDCLTMAAGSAYVYEWPDCTAHSHIMPRRCRSRAKKQATCLTCWHITGSEEPGAQSRQAPAASSSHSRGPQPSVTGVQRMSCLLVSLALSNRNMV